MKAERLVLDTNVLISAALSPAGKPYAVLEYTVQNGVLLFSGTTFLEIRTRLARPRFDRYLSREKRTVFLHRLQLFAEWVTIEGKLRACRDPDDDKLLETALAGGARCLVTGDADLLELNPYEGLPILRPRAFLEALTK